MATVRKPEPPRRRHNDELLASADAADWIEPQHLDALSAADAKTWAAALRWAALQEYAQDHQLTDRELRLRFGRFTKDRMLDRAQALRIQAVVITPEQRAHGAAIRLARRQDLINTAEEVA